MAEDEQLMDRNPTINTDVINTDQLPGKPFRITMELPLFLVMLGVSLCGTALSNIVLYRACIHSLKYPKDECMVFVSLIKNNRSDIEENVQKYVTAVSTAKSILEAVIPATLSLFLGVWSDKHGRKPLVVWPLFGITMTSMLQVIYCMLDNLGPWWYILTLIPYSVCGGFAIFFTGAFCYLSDVTSPKDRSLRMTILESSTSFGSILGSLLSSHVLRGVGYIWLIVIAGACNTMAYAFTNIFVKESLKEVVEGGLSTVFDISLIKEMTNECFKRRINYGRAQLLLLVFGNCLAIFILYGELSLEFLFTREKFHWTLSDYTFFGAISTGISFVGSFIGIVLLQKLLKMGDLLSTNIAFLFGIIQYIVRIVAFSSWHMYLGAAFSIFSGLTAPLIRSFLTKIMPVVDIGKVFALMSAIEGLCPLIAPLMYNALYWYTVSTYPAAIYILSAAIMIICMACITTVQYFRRNATSQYQLLETLLS